MRTGAAPRQEEAMAEKNQQSAEEAWKYAEKAMTWYGWGSPIGMGVFLVCIGLFILLLRFAWLLT
jgi:hypothetical protein